MMTIANEWPNKVVNIFLLSEEAAMLPRVCEKLISVVQDLSKVKKLDEIMAIVRSAARELIGSDGATFVLRDEDQCFYADEDAISPLWKGNRFPMKICISGWCMLNKSQAIIPDVSKDPRINYEFYKTTFVKSMAMVPIRQESPIGAIGCYWAYPHTATQDEMDVLQALANTTAVAIENTQLYTSLEKQVEDLNAANRAKEELLMIVSHELRTPLNAIQGWAQMLLTEDLTKEETQQALEIIERNSFAQGRIIDDLLDTSRIILGRLDLEKKRVNLIDIIKTAVESAQIQALKKKIALSMHCDLKEIFVNGDTYRLMQVINNLLTNAMKFTPENGHIQVNIAKAGPHIQITVTDDGDGMDASFLPYVFNRFRQVDSSTTRRHGGLGLGLAIVKHLVEAHNGKIEAKSDGKGKGCTFSISMPYLLETPAYVAPAPSIQM